MLQLFHFYAHVAFSLQCLTTFFGPIHNQDPLSSCLFFFYLFLPLSRRQSCIRQVSLHDKSTKLQCVEIRLQTLLFSFKAFDVSWQQNNSRLLVPFIFLLLLFLVLLEGTIKKNCHKKAWEDRSERPLVLPDKIKREGVAAVSPFFALFQFPPPPPFLVARVRRDLSRFQVVKAPSRCRCCCCRCRWLFWRGCCRKRNFSNLLKNTFSDFWLFSESFRCNQARILKTKIN